MFSLRTRLIAVAIAALGAVGLTTLNPWWASVTSTLAWISVAGGIVAAIVYRGSSRAFATGFAVVTGLYLTTIMSHHFQPFSSSLITSRLLSVGWRTLDVPLPNYDPAAVDLPRFGPAPDGDLENYALSPYLVASSMPEVRVYNYQLRTFFIVGHSLWALLFGFLGGLLASFLYRRSHRPAPAATSPAH